MPPIEAWKRLRTLLASLDPAHHAQGLELLAAVDDPWLYRQAARDLRAASTGSAGDPRWRRHLPDLPLACVVPRRILHTHRSETWQVVAHESVLRLVALAGDAALRGAPALRVGQRWTNHPSLDLSVLRDFSALRWLELAWAKGLTGGEALDDLPALSCLTAISCQDLTFLANLQLPSLERLLLKDSGPPPLGAWAPRLERLALQGSQAFDLAPVGDLAGLRALQADGVALENAAALRSLAALEDLELHSQDGAADYGFLPDLPGLRRLGVGDREGLPRPVEALAALEELEFVGCLTGSYLDLSPLQPLARLRRLSLGRLDLVLPPSQPLPQVESLRLGRPLSRDHDPEQGSFIEDLPGLRRVALRGWYGASPALWERIARLPRLEAIRLESCAPEVYPPADLAARVRVESGSPG